MPVEGCHYAEVRTVEVRLREPKDLWFSGECVHFGLSGLTISDAATCELDSQVAIPFEGEVYVPYANISYVVLSKKEEEKEK